MQTAQGTYTLAGRNLTIHLYFDLKAFDLLRPALTAQDTPDLIYLLWDSLAAAMPPYLTEKYFYIMRVLKNDTEQSIKLFCSDGILIDSALVLPMSRQAFSRERIKITETDRLPTRFNLSAELIRQMNKRLPLFEEEARRDFPTLNVAAERGSLSRVSAADAFTASEPRATVLSALGNIKKEIRELSLHSVANLQSRMGQTGVSNTALNERISEIIELPVQFEQAFNEATNNINQKTQLLTQIKQGIIDALYASASDYQQVLLPQIQTAATLAKRNLLTDFNRKFIKIAKINEQGEITKANFANDHLQALSFEDLQDFISKEDKDNPGLLQKCNTSWTEESPELKIVTKQLGHLNKTLSDLISNDKQLSRFAKEDMVRMTRIPFPRSFQFKLAPAFFDLKKEIDDYCKAQKEKIQDLAHQYKKTMQVNEMIYRPQRSETLATSVATSTAKPAAPATVTRPTPPAPAPRPAQVAATPKPLISRTDSAAAMQATTVMTPTIEANKIAQQYLDATKQIQNIINQNKDSELSLMLPKVNELINQIQETIRFAVSNDQVLKHFRKSLDLYEAATQLSSQLVLSSFQEEMNAQKTQGKSILLQYIQREASKGVNQDLRRSMITTYTLLDSHIAQAESMMRELVAAKSHFFADFATGMPVDTDLQKLKTKWQALESLKSEINELLARLKKLNADSIT